MEHLNLFKEACRFFPGGVNSPVRAFGMTGQQSPLFIRSAHKSFVIDEKNRCFLDFVGSWGPMIHGHSHPKIVESVTNVIRKGLSFGAPTQKETALAKLIQDSFPQMEMMRFTSSGTEAAMTAIRLARAITLKKIVLKFEGCYHGHSDSLLVQIGSAGGSTNGAMTSDGITPEIGDLTNVLPFNDVQELQAYFEKHGSDVAAVILEPIAGNMGCVPATSDFLKTLQACCKKYSALLIADEVMTGFRVGFHGATGLYKDFQPDLLILGKIVGGGLPLGVVGGKRELLEYLSPLGPVYHAGTLSGNPLAVTAGITSLELLRKENFYSQLHEKTALLCETVATHVQQYQTPFSVHYRTGMCSFFRLEKAPLNFKDVQSQSLSHFQFFFDSLLQKGIYWPPALFEASFISQAHTYEQLEEAGRKIAYSWVLAEQKLQFSLEKKSLKCTES